MSVCVRLNPDVGALVSGREQRTSFNPLPWARLNPDAGAQLNPELGLSWDFGSIPSVPRNVLANQLNHSQDLSRFAIVCRTHW